MIKERIEWVINKLATTPSFRDSNEKLYYQFLKESGYDVNKTVKEFLQDMEKRNIPYIDSIARASRKVQEEHPHLQGKSYRKRMEKEKIVRNEIREI